MIPAGLVAFGFKGLVVSITKNNPRLIHSGAHYVRVKPGGTKAPAQLQAPSAGKSRVSSGFSRRSVIVAAQKPVKSLLAGCRVISCAGRVGATCGASAHHHSRNIINIAFTCAPQGFVLWRLSIVHAARALKVLRHRSKAAHTIAGCQLIPSFVLFWLTQKRTTAPG